MGIVSDDATILKIKHEVLTEVLDKKSLSKMAEDHKTYIDQHEFFDSMDKTFNEITEKL